MKQKNLSKKFNLVVIGGGIMGLFTAYFAADYCDKVLLIEKRTIGNKYAGSSGYTRSIRNDYVDPFYARLAQEAQKMWDQLETKNFEKITIRNGMLNMAKESITPDMNATYAEASYKTLIDLGFDVDRFDNNVQSEYPQIEADLGILDVYAGFQYLPAIQRLLISELKKKGVIIWENAKVKSMSEVGAGVVLDTSNGKVRSDKLIITAGAWTNNVLKSLKGSWKTFLPILPVKQKVEFYEPKNSENVFSYKRLPVFAYLDVGIYGHPIYKDTPGVKVAWFDPYGGKLSKSGVKCQSGDKITSTRDFIKECMPMLKNAKKVKTMEGYYQMTLDNDFIVGRLPSFESVYVGVGFCGTGYKFAPVIGKFLAQSALQKGSVYDLKRFDPSRFGRCDNFTVVKTLPKIVKFLKPNAFSYLVKGIRGYFFPKLPE